MLTRHSPGLARSARARVPTPGARRGRHMWAHAVGLVKVGGARTVHARGFYEENGEA